MAAASVAAAAVAAVAVAVTVRDGGGCSGTCNGPEVRALPSLLFTVTPLPPFAWLASLAEVVVFLAGFSGASQTLSSTRTPRRR